MGAGTPADENYWTLPSLPPIRTSSCKVSSEILNSQEQSPSATAVSTADLRSGHSGNVEASTPIRVKPIPDATAPSTPSTTTTPASSVSGNFHLFHCFHGHKFPSSSSASSSPTAAAASPSKDTATFSSHAHGHGHGHGHRSKTGSLLRSFIGFAGGAFPAQYSAQHFSAGSGMSTPASAHRQTSAFNSPSSRNSGNMMKPGTPSAGSAQTALSPRARMKSTPNLHGTRVSSKGHASNSFTMMPPDVVGRKKPAGYESDEPTSPEVTCIGRVRGQKASWDALVKLSDHKRCDHHKKKGQVKKIAKSNATPRARAHEFHVKSTTDHVEPPPSMSTVAAKLSHQRSGRRRTYDLDDSFQISRQPDMENLSSYESGQAKTDHDSYGSADKVNKAAIPASNVAELHSKSRRSSNLDVKNQGADSIAGIQTHIVDESASLQTKPVSSSSSATPVGDEASMPIPPPADCLLLMRSCSRSRPDYTNHEHEHESHHWNWGQVLT